MMALTSQSGSILSQLQARRHHLPARTQDFIQKDLVNSRFPDFDFLEKHEPARLPQSWTLSSLDSWAQQNPIYVRHLASTIVWTAQLSEQTTNNNNPILSPEAQMFGTTHYRGLLQSDILEGLKTLPIDRDKFGKAATWTNQVYGLHQTCSFHKGFARTEEWRKFYEANKDNYYGHQGMNTWVNYFMSCNDINTAWKCAVLNIENNLARDRLLNFKLLHLSAQNIDLGVEHRYIPQIHNPNIPNAQQYKSAFPDAPIVFALYGKTFFATLAFSVESPTSIILMQKQIYPITPGNAFEIANINWASTALSALVPKFKKAMPRLRTVKVLAAENSPWIKAHPDQINLETTIRKQVDNWVTSIYETERDSRNNYKIAI